jgi:hypothetical protein
MIEPITLLALLYITLAFIAVYASLRRSTPWTIKSVLIAGTTALFFYSYSAHRGLAGWPTDEAMPKRFVLLATVIEEPNKDKASDGRLIVWVNAIEEGKPLKNPRAYVLPYQKEWHALLNESMKKNRQGITQLGSTEPSPGSIAGLSWLRGVNNAQIKLKLTDMPQAQLPEK